MNGGPKEMAETVDLNVRSNAPPGPGSPHPTNTVILALVVALRDLEVQRDKGKVPTSLRSKTAA
jgi:hypothetical protein